jgi:PP-loop superfamily ATP-utilizing enzyme
MTPCLEPNSCASSRVFPTEVKSHNDVSIPKIKEEEGLLKRKVSLEVLPTQFLKKSIPELEPEPIEDIMNRDVRTIDRDVLSFLASCA